MTSNITARTTYSARLWFLSMTRKTVIVTVIAMIVVQMIRKIMNNADQFTSFRASFSSRIILAVNVNEPMTNFLNKSGKR